ncbi:MAG: MoaD/ThiS family protein [Bacteroidota bacterium]
MTVQIQCFGIARDICGGDFIDATLEDGSRVMDLQNYLRETYPELAELRHFFIARNQVYATLEELILADDELVIIPPVSGG